MTSGWLDKTREYKALLIELVPLSHGRARRSGGDLLVEAEVLFNRCDADFKLEAFVDFALLKLGQLGVEAIDFAGEVGLDAVNLCVELVDAAIKACFGSGEVFLGCRVLDDMGEYLANLFEAGFLWCHTRGGIARRSSGARVRRWY
jgi:hypothetical protein